jgi:hypothetical protein
MLDIFFNEPVKMERGIITLLKEVSVLSLSSLKEKIDRVLAPINCSTQTNCKISGKWIGWLKRQKK